jgi:L,D-transpeptidase catalytic domain
VATGWSVQNPLVGWERLRDTDWPATGAALGAVGRKSSLDVRRGPSVGEPGLRFSLGQSSTGAVTFLVIQDYGEWLQVAIPVRPNGTVGWVRSSDIQRLNLGFRVVVELSTNTLVVEHLGKEVYRDSIGSGTGNTPTPTGLFFVRELVKENENGPYGPYVFGLSGYSEVLFSFQGGEGAIGIHGTDAPGSIGSNASFGCVRVSNDSIRSLVHLLPLGTPVEIVQKLSDLPALRRSFAVPDPEPFDEVAAPVELAQEGGPGTDIKDAPSYNASAIDFIESSTPLEPSPVPPAVPSTTLPTAG